MLVFDKVFRRMRGLVRASRYVMTVHAYKEMVADALTPMDIEHVITSGRVFARQRDPHAAEWKYLVEGQTVSGEYATVVAKVATTGMVVVIAVYRCDSDEQ